MNAVRPGTDFPIGGLVILGAERAADGHGVVLNPVPAGRCSFAVNARGWASLYDVLVGVCGRGAAYSLTPGGGFGEKGCLLCGEHARHVRACAECSRWVGRVEVAR